MLPSYSRHVRGHKDLPWGNGFATRWILNVHVFNVVSFYLSKWVLNISCFIIDSKDLGLIVHGWSKAIQFRANSMLNLTKYLNLLTCVWTFTLEHHIRANLPCSSPSLMCIHRSSKSHASILFIHICIVSPLLHTNLSIILLILKKLFSEGKNICI